MAGQDGIHLDQLEDRLITRYEHDIPAERVRACMRDEVDRLADAPVRTFVPILVERAVRARLEQPA
jgi:hypothetical protein